MPAGFRFVVKAASLVTDAALREAEGGKALQLNELFLDPQAALQDCVLPAVQGLGTKLGVLVFQLSPLPWRWLGAGDELIARLESMWRVVVPALPAGSQAALEVRDAALLTPALAASLKAHRVRYCLGLHDRMPSVADQLPLLRATWPGDLVCRWEPAARFEVRCCEGAVRALSTACRRRTSRTARRWHGPSPARSLPATAPS